MDMTERGCFVQIRDEVINTSMTNSVDLGIALQEIHLYAQLLGGTVGTYHGGTTGNSPARSEVGRIFCRYSRSVYDTVSIYKVRLVGSGLDLSPLIEAGMYKIGVNDNGDVLVSVQLSKYECVGRNTVTVHMRCIGRDNELHDAHVTERRLIDSLEDEGGIVINISKKIRLLGGTPVNKDACTAMQNRSKKELFFGTGENPPMTWYMISKDQ